jgi:cellobiose-specific phosphotransferase system component IIB
MDTVGHPLAMATRTRENTNLINAMVVVSIDGTTAASMTACLVKTNAMARAYLLGPMVLFMMENSSMANEKGMDNIPLVMGVNTMDLGRMDGMMDLERVRGKMDDGIKGNGGMVWLMDEERKRIRMGIFDMRDSGLMMNQFVRCLM